MGCARSETFTSRLEFWRRNKEKTSSASSRNNHKAFLFFRKKAVKEQANERMDEANSGINPGRQIWYDDSSTKRGGLSIYEYSTARDVTIRVRKQVGWWITVSFYLNLNCYFPSLRSVFLCLQSTSTLLYLLYSLGMIMDRAADSRIDASRNVQIVYGNTRWTGDAVPWDLDHTEES